jgi:hypothetical protein
VIGAHDEQPNLSEIEVADEILALVRGRSIGGVRGDTSGMAILGTHLQATRRLSHIRDLAFYGAGAEAFILTRSLLSMVARVLWVDKPGDPAERRDRFHRWWKQNVQEDIREQESLQKLGVDVDTELVELREELGQLEDVDGGFPSDRQLLEDEQLGLGPYYSRVYMPASGHVHYSLRSAVEEVQAANRTHEDLDLDRRDYELAKEALRLAILTYGFFVEQSEKTLRHGLSAEVLSIIFDSDAFVAERSRGSQTDVD